MQSIIAVVAAVLIAFGGYRAFRHESDLKPALVTPHMDVHREFSGDLSARFYRVTHAATAARALAHPKLIALTFDDGPYPMFTPLLLDELREMHVPATFFLIGRDAEQWPGISHAVEADGNEIADHTYSHPNLDQESPAQVRDEIIHGRDVLWRLTHDPSVRELMRPPHGRYTLQTLRVAQDLGYRVVLWTDDSGDWRTLTPREIQANLLGSASAPDIVLLHSGKLATIEALPAVVARFRKAGYTFVTAGELLRAVAPAAINHPRHLAV
ncbi:MAG: polysaccharide deacetylase family protein [bacterium]|nr:polysaccharide deacetylase family protein [bacterium]